jgi:hypothetical protein
LLNMVSSLPFLATLVNHAVNTDLTRLTLCHQCA